MASNTYAHPESLVSADWLAEHLRDPSVRVIESNEDVLLYDTGHIPGAVHVDWRNSVNAAQRSRRTPFTPAPNSPRTTANPEFPAYRHRSG